MFIIFLMAFSSGLPLGLTGATLQGWLSAAGVDLGAIGLIQLAAIPYSLKFLWSPFMDRFSPPFLGRRRGWALVSQVGLVVSIYALSRCDPKTGPFLLSCIALVVAFFSASQDIVIDAYRTETLRPEELGPGSGITQLGYRLGANVIGGAVAFILADQMPWPDVFFIVALFMIVGIVATLISVEPQVESKPKSLQDAVILPFIEFLRRRHAVEILFFILFYKMDAAFAVALLTKFVLSLGFTNTDIGTVLKIYGLAASIMGSIVGGTAMVWLGMKRSLWIFGILQGFAGLSLYALAQVGHSMPMLITAISTENFFSGVGNAVYAAFIMSLCDKRYTATQFALLTSVMALTRMIANAPSGYIAAAVGWSNYFLISVLLMIPPLVLLRRYDAWMKGREVV